MSSIIYVPPVRTIPTELELMRGMRDGIVALVGTMPPRAMLAALTAHVALECGRGRYCICWNLGNRKKGALDTLYTAYRCNEQLEDGWHWYLPESEVVGSYGGPRRGPLFKVPPAHPQTRFCAEESLAMGVARHLGFMRRKRYLPAWVAFQAGQPALGCAELHKARYFTANLAPYSKAVVLLTVEYGRKIDDYGLLDETVPGGGLRVEVDDDAEHSPMSDFDLEERVTEFLVPDSMARLNAEFWEGEFSRARDAAVRREGD